MASTPKTVILVADDEDAMVLMLREALLHVPNMKWSLPTTARKPSQNFARNLPILLSWMSECPK